METLQKPGDGLRFCPFTSHHKFDYGHISEKFLFTSNLKHDYRQIAFQKAISANYQGWKTSPLSRAAGIHSETRHESSQILGSNSTDTRSFQKEKFWPFPGKLLE